ncbi:MAG: methyltransferase domain-containing protein [Rhodospirillales bacterium]|nr:methyltransferase domain-containing protein [Rhodospirillales bacterium]
MTTRLHEQRLDAVRLALRRSGARTVLDLGCGEGPLLRRLVHEPDILRIVGIDQSAVALQRLRTVLQQEPWAVRRKADLVQGCFLAPDRSLTGFDAAILVETIEHIEPERLSVLERAVFRDLSPETVVISTPNREFNVLLGVPRHRHRHPDHRFEWDRQKFQSWAVRLARRSAYDVQFEDVAGAHPVYGGPTQMAIFKKAPDQRSRSRI